MQDRIEEYLATRPQAVVECEPFVQQGSNSVVYRGTWQGEAAMFKFSIRNAARREADAYAYFADTGHVPRVFDVFKNQVIVTEFIEGDSLRATELDERRQSELVDALSAVVEQTQHDAKADFSFIEDFRQTLEETVSENSELLAADEFDHSLEAIRQNWEALSEQSGALVFDDLGGENIILSKSGVNFIDLESVWAGNVIMQMGALVHNFSQLGIPQEIEILKRLIEKVSDMIEPNFDAWVAAAYFKLWIRICRFHRWNRWMTRESMRFTTPEDLKNVSICREKLMAIQRYAEENARVS